MSDTWIAYINDKRSVCKYGAKCYQKNPQHAEKFKHPPVNKRGNLNCYPIAKRAKLDVASEAKDSISNVESSNKNEICTDSDKLLSTSDISPRKTRIKSPTKHENIQYHCIPEKPLETVQNMFLCKMPPDFLEFFKFIQNQNTPLQKLLANIHLELIGPYDLLLGKLPKVSQKSKYLVHSRFFYDPPEFQAIIKVEGSSELHFGYYRDSPYEYPTFVASNDSSKGCKITPVADNIFGALNHYLSIAKKTPFTAPHFEKMSKCLHQYAEQHSLSLANENFKKRRPLVVANTFHGAGIVVQYNKKTKLGYRELAESNVVIKRILADLEKARNEKEKDNALSELQPIITYANIAMDECDFGTGLELGVDLFCSGIKELSTVVLATLSSAYSLLKRDAFIDILQGQIGKSMWNLGIYLVSITINFQSSNNRDQRNEKAKKNYY